MKGEYNLNDRELLLELEKQLDGCVKYNNVMKTSGKELTEDQKIQNTMLSVLKKIKFHIREQYIQSSK
jgi:hypothetical protein